MFLLLLLLAVLDFLCGKVLDVLRDHAPDGRYQKALYSLERCQEDVVIIGSSRGESNFVPFVFEDSLHTSCWNASRGGQGLPFFRCMQEGILARYTPKLVILNLEPDILQIEMGPEYEAAGWIRPFYSNHPEIRPFMDRISPLEKWLLVSRLYSYNSSFYYLLRPYIFRGLDGKKGDKGWKPRDIQLDDRLVREVSEERFDEPLNPEAVAEFEMLLDRFRQQGSKVFMVVSPNYARTVISSNTLDYLQKIAKKRSIPLLIYADDRAFANNKDYFADPDHLNETGALVFSKMLCHEISQQLPVYTLKVNN